MEKKIGYVHSIETCGTVDGPGIRFVIFMQGCPLRCQYCHNPDTWKPGKALNDVNQERTVDELFDEIVKYESYMKFSNGGITVTGGEPLLQAEFLTELFKRCKEAGIHTAIDTSGYIFNSDVEILLKYTDLVLLDLKHSNERKYKALTGVELAPTLKFAKYLSEMAIPSWIRYVLVPTLSDDYEDIENLGQFIGGLKYVERVEILPFHKMGEYKWSELGYEYKLGDIQEPGSKLLEDTYDILKKYHPVIFKGE